MILTILGIKLKKYILKMQVKWFTIVKFNVSSIVHTDANTFVKVRE